MWPKSATERAINVEDKYTQERMDSVKGKSVSMDNGGWNGIDCNGSYVERGGNEIEKTCFCFLFFVFSCFCFSFFFLWLWLFR